MTTRQKAELDALAAMPDEQINTRALPEVRDWRGARRGAFVRPIKQQLALRERAKRFRYDWWNDSATWK